MELNEYLTSFHIPWQAFRGKTFLITGYTGLIGRALKDLLLQANTRYGLNIRIIALLHNQKSYGEENGISAVFGAVENPFEVQGEVDYIIHCAGNTDSTYFVQHPVELFTENIQGVKNLLELARRKRVSGFIFLSTMEVYGYPEKGVMPKESDAVGVRTDKVRSCYPVSKLAAESVCCAYSAQYGVPVRILRLTQTFGPGIQKGDKRVFAQFARAARNGQDIVLKTEGLTERSYLYTYDAATAILTVLTRGKNGDIYNVANPQTYCSIRELAKIFCEKAQTPISIRYEGTDHDGQYCDTLYMNMEISKLRSLGWEPKVSLEEMVEVAVREVVL